MPAQQERRSRGRSAAFGCPLLPRMDAAAQQLVVSCDAAPSLVSTACRVCLPACSGDARWAAVRSQARQAAKLPYSALPRTGGSAFGWACQPVLADRPVHAG